MSNEEAPSGNEANHEDVRAQRVHNLEQLKTYAPDPYGQAYERTGLLSEVLEAFEEEKSVRIAGRLVSCRKMGKSAFAHLQDGTGRMQIFVKKDVVGEEALDAFKVADLGDIIGVEGSLFITRSGEQTVRVEKWTLLSKALQPLPEKYHGLQDVEIRYRKRYLDLIANPEVRTVFNQRITLVRELRTFLQDRGFQEVETPMMQPIAGGAAATPFQTYYEALSMDMYLRIAPELYLKRLLVGGFDKVFELNRNFRNEGLSRRHNPEFTMCEIYQAYGDVHAMMELVEAMVTILAEKVRGSLIVGTEEAPVNLTRPWKVVPYEQAVTEKAGEDWFDLSLEAAQERAKELGTDVHPEWDMTELTQEVFEKLVEKFVTDPVFFTRLPAELVPLAKRCRDDDSCVDVFELIIGGQEIAPGYTELNDPIDQRARLLEQAGGDESKLDQEFLDALEYGMPPAGGMGIGIDRLTMLLTGSESIRDVILFPQMRPR